MQSILHHLAMDDSAAQHLQPAALVLHFELEGRLREGEVVVSPALLRLSKESSPQPRQKCLQVLRNQLLRAKE